MIIPTPEFDPFFAPGEPSFRERMVAYIEREFSGLITTDLQQAISTLQPASPHFVGSSEAEEQAGRQVA